MPSCWSAFDFDTKVKRLGTLEKEIENPSIWDDQAAARSSMKELSKLRTDVDDAILQKFFDYLRTLRPQAAPRP